MKKGLVSLILGGMLAVTAPDVSADLHTSKKRASIENIVAQIDEGTPAKIQIVGNPKQYTINPHFFGEPIIDRTTTEQLDFLCGKPMGYAVIARHPFDNTRYCSWRWQKEGNLIRFYMPKIDEGPLFEFEHYKNPDTTNVQMAQDEIKRQTGIYINFEPEPFKEQDVMTPYGVMKGAQIPIDFVGMAERKQWSKFRGHGSLYEKEVMLAEHLSRETGKLWTLNRSDNIHTIRQHNIDYK